MATPGSGPGPPQLDPSRSANSYAEKAKMNVKYDQRLKRNVLEIEVVKTDVNDEMNLSQEVLEKLLKNIGIGMNTQVEGCQVNYGGKATKIKVLCKPGVDLEQFCRQESFQVCRGVVTKNIRPSGRKDVTVTVSGLDFNTPDSLVQDYIENRNVIYVRYEDGPFRGKVNGDRKYQVDFTEASLTMGTYHYLDGERVRVYYRGNTKTCGRCHQGPGLCPGGGIARECQDMGGQKKDLIEHMKELWNQIGFSPTSFKIPERVSDDADDSDNLGGDQKILNMFNFPRQGPKQPLSTTEEDKFTKVRINNFPLEISPSDAFDFMQKRVDKGIAAGDIEMVRDHRSSQIVLGPGPSKSVIIKALDTLDFTKSQKYAYPDRKLYARLHKPLTPEKQCLPRTPSGTVPPTFDNKVKPLVDDFNLETKKIVKPGGPTSQAKLGSAGIAQVAKHKQGLVVEKSKKK